ncbi:MAG TPA: dehydrogenase, partial [Planctomycetes bacterium]|nr:dehydrogenase [Planctomycetota bacterium]
GEGGSPDAMRAAIARAMARSKREIPHYYLHERIDLEPALSWLEAQNESRPIQERILPAALLLLAVARATAKAPSMNGFYEAGAFRPAEGVHLGVAISLPGGGLIAPAIRDADQLALGELQAALVGLVERARSGGLRGAELSSASLTVTNLGDRGCERVFGVIQPPQVALVGLGRIHEAPCVHEGQVVARRVVDASLSADHRVSDGVDGAAFLRRIARLLAKPEQKLAR